MFGRSSLFPQVVTCDALTKAESTAGLPPPVAKSAMMSGRSLPPLPCVIILSAGEKEEFTNLFLMQPPCISSSPLSLPPVKTSESRSPMAVGPSRHVRCGIMNLQVAKAQQF